VYTRKKGEMYSERDGLPGSLVVAFQEVQAGLVHYQVTLSALFIRIARVLAERVSESSMTRSGRGKGGEEGRRLTETRMGKPPHRGQALARVRYIRTASGCDLPARSAYACERGQRETDGGREGLP
jgi:hypothetical protein